MGPNYSLVGERLRQVRGKLSQKLFGEPIGYGYGYVKNCEKGKKPSLEYLTNVCLHYKVSLDWLLFGIEPIGSAAQYTVNETPLNYCAKKEGDHIGPPMPPVATTEAITEMISIMRELAPEAQTLVLGMVKTIVDNSKSTHKAEIAALNIDMPEAKERHRGVR